MGAGAGPQLQMPIAHPWPHALTTPPPRSGSSIVFNAESQCSGGPCDEYPRCRTPHCYFNSGVPVPLAFSERSGRTRAAGDRGPGGGGGGGGLCCGFCRGSRV